MAKKKEVKYTTEEVLQTLDETAKKTESFFEKNVKIISYVFGGILVVTLGYFAYMKSVVEPKNNEGFSLMPKAQELYMRDSLDKAMGAKGITGFKDIIADYEGTKAAEVASLYAGNIAFQKGKYQEAIDYWNEYSGSDHLLNAIKIGSIGDALVELNRDDEALEHFLKAANYSDHPATGYIYLRKAAMLCLANKQNEKALEYFSEMKERFPEECEQQSNEVDMYIAYLKTLLNKK